MCIGQVITIGRKLKEFCPVIGNDVYIGAGSRILGDITIGDNVIICANSVVVSDILSDSIVAGSPGKVLKRIDKSIWDELGEIL